MKATIDHEGVLRVEAETSLECYALRKWMEDHLAPSSDDLPCIRGGFFIDASEQGLSSRAAQRPPFGMVMTNG